MRDRPQKLIDASLDPGFWDRAKLFLHATQTDLIKDGVYRNLQAQLDLHAKANFRK